MAAITLPITFKQGLAAGLPATAPQGEPLWTTDTQQLYVGTGAGRVLIGDANAAPHAHANKAVIDLITNAGGGIIPSAAEMAIITNALVHADVVDNATTTTTDVPLSANQGKVLKDLIDGLGTQFRYADLATRNAQPAGTFTVPDRVFVVDAGGAQWASYMVTAVTDGAGGTTTFDQIQTQADLASGLTAASIKVSYESNADTNAFTDAEKAAIAANTAAIALNTADRHTHANKTVLDLVPGTLGTAAQEIRVNAGATGLEFYTPSAGVTAWTGLSDTPGTFTASNLVAANAGATALEFVDGISGGTF